MYKIISLLALCCIGYNTMFGQISTVKTTVANGLVSLQTPTIFHLMRNPETKKFLSNAVYMPEWGIEDDLEQENLLYSFTQNESSDNDIPATFDQLYQELKSTYKKLKIIDDGIHLTDNRNVGYIVFSGNLNNKKKEGYLFYLSVQNRLLVFAFLRDKKMTKEWKTTLEGMAKSIKVNE